MTLLQKICEFIMLPKSKFERLHDEAYVKVVQQERANSGESIAGRMANENETPPILHDCKRRVS